MHLHRGAVLASPTSPATFGAGRASFLARRAQLATQTRLRQGAGALQGTLRLARQPLPPAGWQRQRRALPSTLPTSQLHRSPGFPETIRMPNWVPWEGGSLRCAPAIAAPGDSPPNSTLPESEKTHLSRTSLTGAGFALVACPAFPKTQPVKAKLSLPNPQEFGRAACAKLGAGAPSPGGWPRATPETTEQGM